MKEIIVYLDDYKYSGYGRYDVIYLDFRTIEDYYLCFNEPWLKRGTFIEIKNFSSPKRLVRGAYYSLNMEMINQLELNRANGFNGNNEGFNGNNEGSNIIVRTYDFNSYVGRNDETFHLLQSHEPLNPEELSASTYNTLNSVNELNSMADLKFRVNDVNQANWNEVLQGGKVRVVYDMGAPISASKEDVCQYINRYASQYAKDRPCLVLSHWDMDHCHCLLGMSDDEIRNFTKLICVDMMRSATSQQLYQRLLKLLGPANVYCFKPYSRTAGSNYPLMHKEFSNSVLWVYTGESSRNTNYSGVVLYVKGNSGNVIFSGDCLPCQASDVLNNLNSKKELNSNHYLLVPHHGGDFKGKYKTYQIPQGVNAVEAIISVDGGNNNYGHPDAKMIKWLSGVAGWNILRTDEDGTIKRRL